MSCKTSQFNKKAFHRLLKIYRPKKHYLTANSIVMNLLFVPHSRAVNRILHFNISTVTDCKTFHELFIFFRNNTILNFEFKGKELQ